MSDLLPIDVIIPAWGTGYTNLLPRALASAAAAASRIVVGDAGTREIALTNGATHVIELQDKHPGPARNLGFEHSIQPYVLFMDADDALMPGALEKMYATLAAHPKSVGAFGHYQRSTDGIWWPKPKYARLTVSPLGMHGLLFRNSLPSHGSILLRRERLKPGFTYSSLMNEDWHAALHIRASGRLHLIPEALYDYTVATGSMSRSHRDGVKLQQSSDLLLPHAEQALGRRALTLRFAEIFARRRRNRRIREEVGNAVYAQIQADIDYS